jgi:FkbM family methyltransferase
LAFGLRLRRDRPDDPALHAEGTSRVAAAGDSLETIRLAEFPDHPLLIAERDQVIRKYVRATGQWEPGLASYLGSLLPRSAHVVIGGGHIGLLVFQLWRARRDIAEIVAFEPASVNAALLATNVLSWGDSPVRAMPLALGSRSELVSLAQNPFNTGDNRLWDTIPAELHAGGGDPSFWPRHLVVCAALDDVWGDAPLDLILLDTQGWEPDVLKGAERLLRTRRPLVVFEWWPRALTARGVDLEAFLKWLEQDLEMTLGVVPPEASGFSNPSLYDAAPDIRRITELLLIDPDPAAYVELLARHRGTG